MLTNQHAFDLRLTHSYFFGAWRGWSVQLHALALSFRIALKHQNHVPENRFQKVKAPFLFWFGEMFFETISAQIFLVTNSLLRIWWTVAWVKINSFSTNLTVLTKWSLTTFSMVLEVECLPLRGLSLIDSLPSENVLNQNPWRKTISVILLKFCQTFHWIVAKSEGKSDSKPLLEINVSHF